MSFPPPTPNQQQQPNGQPPEKMWKGVPAWSWIVGPAIVVFWVYVYFVK